MKKDREKKKVTEKKGAVGLKREPRPGWFEGDTDAFARALLHPPEGCLIEGDPEAERAHLLVCLLWFGKASLDQVTLDHLLHLEVADFIPATRELRLPRLRCGAWHPQVERAEIAADDPRVVLPMEVVDRLQAYLKGKSEGRVFSKLLRRSIEWRTICTHARRQARSWRWPALAEVLHAESEGGLIKSVQRKEVLNSG